MSRRKSNKSNKIDIDTYEDEKRELWHARVVICERLERFSKFLENESQKQFENIDQFQIECRLKSVEEDQSEVDKIQTRLEFLDENAKDHRLETESVFYDNIAKARKLVMQTQQKSSSNCNSASQQPANQTGLRVVASANIPDFGLPTFHGKYETWYSFKDIFTSVIDSRQDISNINKLLVLKSCLKEDAATLIESLELIDSNYSIAWDILNERFDHKRAIINTHVNTILFNLPTVNRESSVQIRKLLDTLHQHLSALEKLQMPVKQWDTLLIPIILQKLDDRTKREWESRQIDQNAMPTLQQLREFLTKKCFTLETTIQLSEQQKSSQNKFNSNSQSKFQMQSAQNMNKRISCPATNNNTAQQPYQNSQNSNLSCYLCKQNHYLYQCPTFINLPHHEKYNELNRHKLCSNCLRPGHGKPECFAKGCKKCHLKHNTALHVDNFRQNQSYYNQNSPQVQQNPRNPNIHIGNVAISSSNPSPSAEGAHTDCEAREAREREFSVTQSAAPSFQNQSGAQTGPQSGGHTMCIIDQNLVNAEMKNNFSLKSEIKAESNEIGIEKSQKIFTHATVDSNQVLLSTATVLILDNFKNWQKCTALLDSGSQSNIITQSLCDKLNLKCEQINIPLCGINQIETKITKKASTTIKSRFNEFEQNLQFLVLPKITEKLPLIGFEKTRIVYPQNIKLADEQFNVPKEIDILLGAGLFFDLLKEGRIKLGNDLPVLQETCLGWIITGNLNLNVSRNVDKKQICNLTSKISNKQLHDSLTKFWKLEELETNPFLSKTEQYCETYFKETTQRDKNGTFIVKYPFKTDYQQLGDSKTTALKRFYSLETRLLKNNELKEQYVDFMREYESLGHMTLQGTLENDKSDESKSYFLPHTAVLREQSLTTKCRVVFDASAKTSTNISFNDIILSGPTIQDDLFSILLRLRLRKHVLSADVKMMYRCIQIDPSERCYQKIIWRENIQEKLKIYELNTVTYGTSSAPFQATRCLQELSIQNQNKYPRTSKIIQNSFYMDDLLTSLDEETECIEVYHEISKILSSANFELRKWSSNNKNLLNYILQNNKSKDGKLVIFHEEKELKTLGITWDANNDLLKYSIKLRINENKITKRNILSIISQIFDPLGLVGPAIIKAKLIIQQLWHLKLEWDQEVPLELKNYWLEFVNQLEYLNKISIERHVIIPKAERIELYGFSDSSEKAYGACVYLGSIANGNKTVKLLTAKSRVAPLKKQSLPRLELLSAHLLADLVYKVKNTLDIHVSKTVYFTDSTIVLSWLRLEPCTLQTFVANRVSKITEISSIENWRHIKSKDNAADIISRGLNPKELLENKIWFNGPEFLQKIDSVNENFEFEILDNLPELKQSKILLHTHENIDGINPKFDIFKRFSTYSILVKVVAYVFRFKNQCLKQSSYKSKILTVEELQNSEKKLIKLAQNQNFKQEIQTLKNSKNVGNDSKLQNLNPFLDNHNILRVGGRLSHSDVKYDQKHPVILPYKHRLTDLIILDQHLKNLHAGTQNLLSIIRLKFWPINGKNAVKKVLRSCVRCYRVKPKPCKFLMGELPSARVKPSRPFSNCGIDYAGPILVKEGTLRRSKIVKTYICIFVCFCTRAIHIELATDLTTNSFLNALKRFCARRGKPSNIHSDNGLNFIGANNYFVELYNLINDPKHNESVTHFLANEQIKWHFIPARSAHMGGLWEAAVKSAKYHLKRVIGDASLSFEEMYTLLVQIEACLNSRPLTALSNDPQDYLPLTPSHFLIGDSIAGPPEADFSDVKMSRLSRYQHLQKIYQQFWDRWSQDYLHQLQTRSKWKKNIHSRLQIGSLVLVVEDNLPPLKWPLARVIELHKGADNIVRVAVVQMPNGNTTKRAISRICLLPIDGDEEQ